MKQHEVGTQHFVAPNGANTIVKYFSAKAGCQLSFNRHVADVTKCDEKWYWAMGTINTTRKKNYHNIIYCL